MIILEDRIYNLVIYDYMNIFLLNELFSFAYKKNKAVARSITLIFS